MPTILTRAGKGSELTHNELDANFKRTVTAVTTTYQVLAADNRSLIECSHASTPFTVTMITVANAAAEDTGDFETTFFNINAAVVSIDGSGSETINGATDAITLKQWDSVTIKLNNAGTGWNTVSRVGDLGAVDVDSITSGGNIVSDTDSTDDLGTTGVRWANLYVDDATVTNDVTATGLIANTLAFPATQVPSADVNTLDDYEEGTFTPTLQADSLSDAESQTYTTQFGRYTKIGDTVHFTIRLVVNSVGSLTGAQQARIAGLPFTSSSDAVAGGATSTRGSSLGLTLSDLSVVVGNIPASVTYMELWQYTSNLGTDIVDINDISAGGSIDFHGHYFV